ncbi:MULTISPECIES: hypothetical protein [Rhodococcus]|uniref:hypothetical protein n=1 Tax=Rhodococcus TaxID=1827 RepID=UPI002954459F|nr:MULTISPECIES: hypothetical protein [Rhodococcus]MDV7246378.1 hypothetical protein [Rhodococcus oxybenzonivorans]MDV7337340.1 hypothetical protein [Rhodococcus oxybenzonivorans]MDV7348040.1 hypothetical protein [Rhodococcus oxybenzonivorans]MDV8031623.1 hypothetical protein [Rhodococcus sp. IEGM 27]
MRLSRLARCFPLLVAFCAAAAVWVSPSAAADVVDVTIVPGLSVGPTTAFGVGCTYLAVATTADSLSTPSERDVTFLDYNSETRGSFGPEIATFFPQNFVSDYYVTPVVFDHALVLWTPTVPGEHNLMAYQTSAGGPVETVTVNPGTPIGPACIVAP